MVKVVNASGLAQMGFDVGGDWPLGESDEPTLERKRQRRQAKVAETRKLITALEQREEIKALTVKGKRLL